MDSVLTAIVVVFIIIFAVLTLSYAYFSSQEIVIESWQSMESRLQDTSRTDLTPVTLSILDAGTRIQWSLRNTGQTRLSDFSQWDAFLQYYDSGSPSTYHIGWVPYASAVLMPGQWQMSGISIDAITEEAYEPSILNPGEIMTVAFNVMPPVGPGTTVQTVLTTPNGVTVSAFATRNRPPTLAVNTGTSVETGASVVLTDTLLSADDLDNAPSQLVYTVTVLPTQGTLSLGAVSPAATFTQADLDNGLVSYTATGTGADSFSFTISDGEASIGAFNFAVTITVP